MENKWIVTGSEMESIVMVGGDEGDVGNKSEQEENIEGGWKGRREGGSRGRLVRQVATFEPEEIRSQPPDPSQVIYSERISVSANSTGSFTERQVLTPCNTLSSRGGGFGNHRQLTIESVAGSGGANIAGATFAGRGSTKSSRSTSSKHLVMSLHLISLTLLTSR